MSTMITRFGFRFLKWGCILHCISNYGVWFCTCVGSSMQPTLYSGDVLLVDRFTRHFGQIKRNDIVCLHDHRIPSEYMCKRLVGMEGDSVYNSNSGDFVRIPKGYIWVEGDNSFDSMDSRSFGAIPYGLIHSKVLYKFGGGFL